MLPWYNFQIAIEKSSISAITSFSASVRPSTLSWLASFGRQTNVCLHEAPDCWPGPGTNSQTTSLPPSPLFTPSPPYFFLLVLWNRDPWRVSSHPSWSPHFSFPPLVHSNACPRSSATSCANLGAWYGSSSFEEWCFPTPRSLGLAYPTGWESLTKIGYWKRLPRRRI